MNISKKKIIIIVVLILIAIVGWLSYEKALKAKDEKDTYYGNIDTRTVTIGFRFSNTIVSMFKDEGQNVHKGELLAVLDSRDINSSLNEAKANLEAEKAALAKFQSGYRIEDIAKAKAHVAAANSKVATTKDTYSRYKKLIESNAISKIKFVNAKESYNAALADLRSASSAYSKMTSGFRVEDVNVQLAKVKALEARVAKLRVDLEDTKLYSPVNGVVLTRYKEVGSIVNPGESLFEIAKRDEFWVRAYVDEPNFGDIQPHEKMLIYTDSSKKPYEGYVGFISPVAEFTPKQIESQELRTDLVYRFRVIVQHPDEKIRQGMPVTIKLQK